MCGSGGRGCTEIERKIKRERKEKEGRERQGGVVKDYAEENAERFREEEKKIEFIF